MKYFDLHKDFLEWILSFIDFVLHGIFIEDIVSENIHQYSVKSDNLFMNSFIHEHKIPFNYFNCFLY